MDEKTSRNWQATRKRSGNARLKIGLIMIYKYIEAGPKRKPPATKGA